MNEKITLIGYTETTDEYGRTSRVETRKDVLAEVKSISQSEFYQAQGAGLKPIFKFVIADYYDYNDEKEVEYNNTRYSVERTYREKINLELTAYGLNK